MCAEENLSTETVLDPRHRFPHIRPGSGRPVIALRRKHQRYHRENGKRPRPR